MKPGTLLLFVGENWEPWGSGYQGIVTSLHDAASKAWEESAEVWEVHEDGLHLRYAFSSDVGWHTANEKGEVDWKSDPIDISVEEPL